jgi:hypothetical protein
MRLPGRRIVLALSTALLLAAWLPLTASDTPEILPLSQVKPGMQGVAYTIFAGDQIEKMDLSVIGVLHNALGPKQDVILVELHGPNAEHAGVVAGMSGSPVYLDGKLAGALSLKLGLFTKEAIGGVTPIENILDVEKALVTPSNVATMTSVSPSGSNETPGGVPIPHDLSEQIGLTRGRYLVPIETPLIFAGLYPQTLTQFGGKLSSLGLTAMAGGTAAPSPEDSQLKPGDMVGMDLIRGDLSLSAGCTVTRVTGDRIFACGHPLFGFGSVSLPLSRGHVVMTLASSLASTKIMNTGGVIGTLTQDRATAVMAVLGPGPPTIPMDLEIVTPAQEKAFHFELIESPQLTPLLVAVATFNGVVGNTAYSEGSTLRLSGTIELNGHTPVKLEDLFAPSDVPVPSGFAVAGNVESTFARLYLNPYEPPRVQKIHLRIDSLPEKRWAAIDGAWSEKSEAHPGETVRIKVLLRPYRGAPFIQEIPVAIPPQAARGNLRLLVSDAETLNRTVQTFSAAQQSQLPGLEELIRVLNRERHNDRLYATLLQPTPTLLVEDKEMPNVPLSEISVLDQRQNPGGARLLAESSAGEWSVEMKQVITGQHYLTITVK